MDGAVPSLTGSGGDQVLGESQVCCQNPHWRLMGFQGKLWSLVSLLSLPVLCVQFQSLQTTLTQLPSPLPHPPPFTPPRLFTTKQFVLFPTFWRIWERKCSNNSCLSSHLPPAGMGMLRTSLSECQMSRGCRLVPRAP